MTTVAVDAVGDERMVGPLLGPGRDPMVERIGGGDHR